MQGTIKSYDEQSRSGIVVDDAKNEFAYDPNSFKATGMRMFRIGQRVDFRLEGQGTAARVRDLHILTIHS